VQAPALLRRVIEHHAARQQHAQRIVGRLLRLIPHASGSGGIEARRKHRQLMPSVGKVRPCPAQLPDAQRQRGSHVEVRTSLQLEAAEPLALIRQGGDEPLRRPLRARMKEHAGYPQRQRQQTAQFGDARQFRRAGPAFAHDRAQQAHRVLRPQQVEVDPHHTADRNPPHRLTARYPDGQIVVDMAGTSAAPLSPAQGLARVIRAFEPLKRLPEEVAELRPIYLSVLRGKRVLLILDNAHDGDQVAPLLPPEHCALIVTSRRSPGC
jgi:hypothetical protein